MRSLSQAFSLKVDTLAACDHRNTVGVSLFYVCDRLLKAGTTLAILSDAIFRIQISGMIIAVIIKLGAATQCEEIATSSLCQSVRVHPQVDHAHHLYRRYTHHLFSRSLLSIGKANES